MVHRSAHPDHQFLVCVAITRWLHDSSIAQLPGSASPSFGAGWIPSRPDNCGVSCRKFFPACAALAGIAANAPAVFKCLQVTWESRRSHIDRADPDPHLTVPRWPRPFGGAMPMMPSSRQQYRVCAGLPLYNLSRPATVDPVRRRFRAPPFPNCRS